MKKSVSNKIEALLSSVYGDVITQKNGQGQKRTDEKRESDQRRSKMLSFEFIHLLF